MVDISVSVNWDYRVGIFQSVRWEPTVQPLQLPTFISFTPTTLRSLITLSKSGQINIRKSGKPTPDLEEILWKISVEMTRSKWLWNIKSRTGSCATTGIIHRSCLLRRYLGARRSLKQLQFYFLFFSVIRQRLIKTLGGLATTEISCKSR